MANASITIKLTPREFDLIREAIELALASTDNARILSTDKQERWLLESKTVEFTELSETLHQDG